MFGYRGKNRWQTFRYGIELNFKLFSRNTFLDDNLNLDLKICNYFDPYLNELFETLGSRYILFGECTMFTHYIYYNQLPSWFLESDIYDLENEYYLSSKKRHELLQESNIVSVPILNKINNPSQIKSLKFSDLIVSSLFNSIEWQKDFSKLKNKENLQENSKSEGLYLKFENSNKVISRFKFIRKEFISEISEIIDNEFHWSKRNPIIYNEKLMSNPKV